MVVNWGKRAGLNAAGLVWKAASRRVARYDSYWVMYELTLAEERESR